MRIGDVSYDSIVKQGSNKNKVVQSSMNDIKEKDSEIDKIVLPEKEEEDETAKRTKAALEAIINSKISSGKVATNAVKAAEKDEASYIRYTANPSAPGKLLTHFLIYSLTHSLTYLLTHQVTSPK